MSQEIAAPGNEDPAEVGWDQRFEELLRPFLPFLSADEPLERDSELRELGLDSMGTVELLAALEGAYGVRFREDALELGNFANPGVLWHTLTRMTEPAS